MGSLNAASAGNGAGTHSKNNEKQYKEVCKSACLQAMALLKTGSPALDAVTAAVTVLEDDECTNAGQGSTLNIHGCVECEACAMDGASLLFGAVGALSNVKNPICVASKLVKEQMKGPLSLGRIRPSILVGKGAQLFCSEHGIETNHKLTTDSTLKTYNKYKRKCHRAEERKHKRKRISCDSTEGKNAEKDIQSSASGSFVQDTVGTICVDQDGTVATGSSSGGIWLKHPGRIGPIAMYGTGCWAQNLSKQSKHGVAVVTSGCGEHLMATVLAKTLADGVRSSQNLSQSLPDVFQSGFLKSEFLERIQERLGGALVLKSSRCDDGNECWRKIFAGGSHCHADTKDFISPF